MAEMVRDIYSSHGTRDVLVYVSTTFQRIRFENSNSETIELDLYKFLELADDIRAFVKKGK